MTGDAGLRQALTTHRGDSTTNLTTFLLARLDEDEQRLPHSKAENFSTHWPDCDYPGDLSGYCNCDLVPRLLNEIAAKRAIIHQVASGDGYHGDHERVCTAIVFQGDCDCGADIATPILRALAAVYADHPDFNPEWAA